MTDLSGDPRLLVGGPAAHPEVRRVDLHVDVITVLRKVTLGVLEEITHKTMRPYEAFAALDEDQAYEIPLGSPVADLTTAALIDAVRQSHGIQPISAQELTKRRLAFYAICWGEAGTPGLALIRRLNPQRVVKPGHWFFAYHDVLRTVEQPTFMLDDRADLVVADDRIVMLNEVAGRGLLADIKLAQTQAVQNFAEISTTLGAGAFTDTAEDLFVRASERVTVARRLSWIAETLRGKSIAPATLVAKARSDFDDWAELIDERGRIVVSDPARVNDVLEILEGRLFQDPISGEHRRADRMSRRERKG